MSQTFIKHDQAKATYHLTPTLAEEEMMRVLEYGARKYAPDNWRNVGSDLNRYYNAARRHMTAWVRGERFDPETGRHHLAHAMCCLSFIVELELEASHES